MSKKGTRYKWREGTMHASLTADVAADIFTRLAENGGLTPEAVVAEAKAKSSPLHVAFEWDDDKAAHRFRLVQARYLIKQVEVVVEDAAPAPVFYSIKSDSGRSYRTAEAVVQNADWYENALSQLKNRMDGAADSMQSLIGMAEAKRRRRLMPVSRAIEAAREAVLNL